jgi:alkylhydroperoxidase/carboxymuconolactone decarboxylase family protein YurZ
MLARLRPHSKSTPKNASKAKCGTRSGLSLRDRSLITIAALIACVQAPALMYYADQAVEIGVKPRG